MRHLLGLLLAIGSITNGAAQGVPQPPVAMAFTHAEIEANLNLVNEAVKALGLSQPQRTQDALMLLVKFQNALKAEAEARARAPTPEPAPPAKD